MLHRQFWRDWYLVTHNYIIYIYAQDNVVDDDDDDDDDINDDDDDDDDDDDVNDNDNNINK